FWAAAVANGCTVIPVPYGPYNKPKGLGKPREISLKNVNVKAGATGNDDSFKAILEAYPFLKKELDK
ncbi:MAG: glycosyltransferase, partial [Duncaniella sp.]|nr:glycosyltransferase [Duncaniella sp.]